MSNFGGCLGKNSGSGVVIAARFLSWTRSGIVLGRRIFAPDSVADEWPWKDDDFSVNLPRRWVSTWLLRWFLMFDMVVYSTLSEISILRKIKCWRRWGLVLLFMVIESYHNKTKREWGIRMKKWRRLEVWASDSGFLYVKWRRVAVYIYRKYKMKHGVLRCNSFGLDLLRPSEKTHF